MTQPFLADRYYGGRAERYEEERAHKTKWANETEAVRRFLCEGPVLDVPFGTGRFVPIYAAKGLAYTGIDVSPDMLAQARARHGEVNARIGSAFDLPFAPGSFATVVCVRFFEWMPIEMAAGLLSGLAKIGRTLIVTITHGVEGRPEAYTYDHGRWLAALDGLMIEDRAVTAHVRDMTSEVFKLRPATWYDVLAQFSHDHPGREAENVQRLADKFAGFFGLSSVPITKAAEVRAEYWPGDRLADCVSALSAFRFVTDEPPRADGPLTVVEREGRALMIDGRKRANRLMREAGPHPVLVVRP